MTSARILRLPEVVLRTGRKRTQIYAAIARAEFPKQVPIGPNAVGWLESEIDEWILEQARKRHTTPQEAA
jgi:prophage regulatory protein